MTIPKMLTDLRERVVVRELVRNNTLMTLAQIYQLVIAGLFQILMARHLGVDSIGLFAAGQALVGIVYSMAQLSVDVPAKREVSRISHKLQAYFGNALGLRITVTLPATLLFSVGAGMISGISDLWTIALLAVYTSLNGIVVLLGSSLQALNRFKSYAVASTIAQTAFYGIMVILLMSFAKLHVLLAGMAFGQLVLAAFYALVLHTGGALFAPEWNLHFWKMLVLDARPVLLATIAAFISLRSGALFVSALIGDTAAGIYAAAQSFYMLAVVCAYVVSLGAFPTFARYSGERSKADYRKLIGSISVIIALYGISLGMIVFWLGSLILPVLYGQEFAPAIDLLRVLSFALPFVALNRFMSEVLNASEGQAWTFRATLAGAIVTVSLNVFLIPRFGILAAGAATVAAEALVCAVAWDGFRRASSIPESICGQ